MLKEMVASQTAKLIAACVCPVVGATALTVSVPKVRSAVHKATSPTPARYAHAKPRVRLPLDRGAPPAGALATAQPICPEVTPIVFANAPLSNGVEAIPEAVALGPNLPTRVADARVPGIDNRPGSPIFPGVPGVSGGGGGLIPPNTGGPGDVVVPGVVPEPATWVQMIIGFGVVGGATRVSWKQQKRKKAAG